MAMVAGPKVSLLAWVQSPLAEPPLILIGESTERLAELSASAACAAVCLMQDVEACGTCQACKQALSGNHPDVLTVAGEGQTISLEEVRGMLERMTSRAFGDKRVVIITGAERLTQEAVSALLKPLEEASAATRYLLTTRYRRRILPTIRSRARILVIPSEAKQSSAMATLPPSLTPGRHQGPLTDEELEAAWLFLRSALNTQSPSGALYRSFLRLRDYYKIRGQRGNVKLAGEVLLQSLAGKVN